MGLIVMGALIAGVALGLLLSGILFGIGVVLATRTARSRTATWPSFLTILFIAAVLALAVVHSIPYPAVNPGSDYDIAVRNLFLQGLSYSAIPGVATMIAAIGVGMLPRGSNNVIVASGS